MTTHRTPLRAVAFVVAVFALVLGFAASPGGAVGAADQSQPVADGSILVVPGLLQTFTVGRTGRLDAVQITSSNGGPANVQIYKVGATLPGTPLLASNLSVALMPGQAATIGLGQGIDVTAGDVLGIAVGGIRSTSAVELADQAVGTYAGGTLYRVNSISSFTDTGADLQFATFVTEPAAPAATSLSLARLKTTKGAPTATLTSGGAGVAGKTITFAMTNRKGATVATCSAVTGATGVAACATRWNLPDHGTLVASFAGDAGYLASTATILG